MNNKHNLLYEDYTFKNDSTGEEYIKIPKENLEKHRTKINEGFMTAGKEIDKGTKSSLENADITGINICLHWASTILLLESTTTGLDAAMKYITEDKKNIFYDLDPSTILTVSVLFHLIKCNLNNLIKCNINKLDPDDDYKYISAIYKRFDKIAWMIGKEAMDELGFEKLI